LAQDALRVALDALILAFLADTCKIGRMSPKVAQSALKLALDVLNLVKKSTQKRFHSGPIMNQIAFKVALDALKMALDAKFCLCSQVALDTLNLPWRFVFGLVKKLFRSKKQGHLSCEFVGIADKLIQSEVLIYYHIQLKHHVYRS
jgi:hypothetical protein